jgi:multidrug efflux pump subunit AcrA (membrane-fusion protein)
MKKVVKIIASTLKKLKLLGNKFKSKFMVIVAKVNKWIVKYPMTAFFGMLIVLFALIFISNFLQTPKKEEVLEEASKKVSIFSIGSVPYRSFQAKSEKSGTITIYAQTGGIVNNILVSEGDQVPAYKTLVSLASNYFGGNAASLQRQIAQKQYDNTSDTFGLQKAAIGKQREVALDSNTNAANLREITAKSISETQDLINLYESMIRNIDKDIEATSSASVTLQSSKIQAQSALYNLTLSLRNSKYQADEEGPAALIADAQRELTLRQLEIQEKGLDFGLEVSELQLKLAKISEATMFPASPFAGTIDRVFVKKGQLVNPGTPLVSISSANSSVKIVALVPAEVAKNISPFEPSIINFDDNEIKLLPNHISGDVVESGLFGVTYVLENAVNVPAEGEYVSVSIPVGKADSLASIVSLPLTAVYQTENESYVLVAEDGKAVVRKVKLGEINGSFVSIEDGVNAHDQIIVNRSVKASDMVEIVY